MDFQSTRPTHNEFMLLVQIGYSLSSRPVIRATARYVSTTQVYECKALRDGNITWHHRCVCVYEFDIHVGEVCKRASLKGMSKIVKARLNINRNDSVLYVLHNS